MQIRLLIHETEVQAELYDHPVAHELFQRLPLQLAFDGFNGVEKAAVLDTPLTLTGVPDADAPSPGEIGYHARELLTSSIRLTAASRLCLLHKPFVREL